MPIERYKDVTIEGRDFRVGRVTAMVGDWITRNLTSGMNGMGESGYNRVRGYLLSECSLYKNADGQRVPLKVFEGDRLLVPDLEYDLETVNRLCEMSMKFNFDDFFEKRMAEAEAEKATKEAARVQPLTSNP